VKKNRVFEQLSLLDSSILKVASKKIPCLHIYVFTVADDWCIQCIATVQTDLVFLASEEVKLHQVVELFACGWTIEHF